MKTITAATATVAGKWCLFPKASLSLPPLTIAISFVFQMYQPVGCADGSPDGEMWRDDNTLPSY